MAGPISIQKLHWCRKAAGNFSKSSSLSSSLSYMFHGVRPLVDPFRSHVSRSLFKGLPWFLLSVGEKCFITLGNLFRGILFTCCIQLLLYSSNLSKIGVIFNSFAIRAFVLQSVPSVSCCSSHVFHFCCCYSSGVPCLNSPSFAAI